MIEQSRQIVQQYIEDYRIEDEVLASPFIVLKATLDGRPAWWNGEIGKKKVLRLIEAFKSDLLISEACVYTGITENQFRYFCTVHETFSHIKARLKSVIAISAKRGLISDIRDPKGFRTRQWYLEKRQPQIYGRDTNIPDGAVAKFTAEAFLDENGKMTVSKQTSEILDEDEDDDQSEFT